MKYKLENYFTWIKCCFVLVVIITMIIYIFDVENIGEYYQRETLPSMIEILKNNSKNFIMYMFLFIISPILIIMDIFNIVGSIYFGIKMFGEIEVILRLVPHGVFEFPNLMLYSSLSWMKCVIFYKEKSIYKIFQFVKENKKIYMFSYFLVVFSAVLEGVFYGN